MWTSCWLTALEKQLLVLHVVRAEETDQAVVGFWWVSHVGWYQVICWVKHLRREAESAT